MNKISNWKTLVSSYFQHIKRVSERWETRKRRRKRRVESIGNILIGTTRRKSITRRTGWTGGKLSATQRRMCFVRKCSSCSLHFKTELTGLWSTSQEAWRPLCLLTRRRRWWTTCPDGHDTTRRTSATWTMRKTRSCDLSSAHCFSNTGWYSSCNWITLRFRDQLVPKSSTLLMKEFMANCPIQEVLNQPNEEGNIIIWVAIKSKGTMETAGLLNLFYGGFMRYQLMQANHYWCYSFLES